jgi:hypothetical protein
MRVVQRGVGKVLSVGQLRVVQEVVCTNKGLCFELSVTWVEDGSLRHEVEAILRLLGKLHAEARLFLVIILGHTRHGHGRVFLLCLAKLRGM